MEAFTKLLNDANYIGISGKRKVHVLTVHAVMYNIQYSSFHGQVPCHSCSKTPKMLISGLRKTKHVAQTPVFLLPCLALPTHGDDRQLERQSFRIRPSSWRGYTGIKRCQSMQYCGTTFYSSLDCLGRITTLATRLN